MASKKKFLVLTNAYPSEDDLYRNGFIHRRVKSYQRYEIEIEVFVLYAEEISETYEFDHIKVMKGNKNHLFQHLRTNDFFKTLIHFVSPEMIEIIKQVKPRMPLLIWIHGFEAEAWHRRYFNFLESKEQLRKILEMSQDYYRKQLELMNWLYQTDELDLTFIHVSKWFKEHVAECDARTRTQNAHIIPNLIDEHVFTYEKKGPEQRLKILSIRPYASKKYANDLAVKAVLELTDRPFFDRLEFAFYGDGRLFHQTLEPLMNSSNVHIYKGFLKQEEIAKLHKNYGIFLCPTRLDSQGVSMCEAMASGLVPISTNITAIPEFVTNRVSGLLSKPEDPVHLADQIETLFFHEDLFLKLSKNAATTIIEKCGIDHVINKEMELILR